MQQPNIILVVSDQHRGDFMGNAGNAVVRTPNMDKLAADGISFTNNYCNSPLCVPSRMSMMTGRYPCHTGVFGNEDCLRSDMPTFAHALSLGGYETVLCGRMHFVGADQRHGFQQRLVGDITPSYSGGPKTDYGMLAGTTDSSFLSIELAGQGDNPVLRYDEKVTAACEQFLHERSQAQQEKPFLLTVGLYGPHNPYTSTKDEYENALMAMEAHDRVIPADREPHPWIKETIDSTGLNAMTDEQLMESRAHYIGLVNLLDQYIGRIVTAAEKLQEDTILVYVSDHGDMAGDHGLFWKRVFYEGSAKVPMIWYPVVQKTADLSFAKGRRINFASSLVDLAPTLVSLSGSPALPYQDGTDLTPLLLDKLDSNDFEMWYERPAFSELISPNKAPARMIRYQDYKLIYYHGYSHPQLFNLREDPDELHDLSQVAGYEDLRDELQHKVLQHWDAEQLISERDYKRPDLDYMKRWGETVGMGRLDLWDDRISTGGASL